MIRTEAGMSFHGSGLVSKNQFLFGVTPGVELADALSSVSDLLDMIHCSVYEAAMGHEPLKDNPAWLVVHAIDSAKAVVDSLGRAAMDAAKKEEKQDMVESAQNGVTAPSGQNTLVGTK